LNTSFKRSNRSGLCWLLVYGAYIVARAVQAVVDPEFAGKIISGGHYQWDVPYLKFSYAPLTLLHPLIFAVVSVEVAKRAYSSKLFITVLLAHFIVCFLIGLLHAIEWWHAIDSIGVSTFTGVSSPEGGGTEIIESQELLKGLIVVFVLPIILYFSIQWWRKPIIIFSG